MLSIINIAALCGAHLKFTDAEVTVECLNPLVATAIRMKAQARVLNISQSGSILIIKQF